MNKTIAKASLAGASRTCLLGLSLLSLSSLALSQISGWGDTRAGQLLTVKQSETTPVSLLAVGDARSVASLSFASFALRLDGTVAGWGTNQWGMIGPTPDGTLLTSATTIPGLSGVVELQAGSLSLYALTASRDLYSWGANTRGELGQGIYAANLPIGLVGRLNPGDRYVAATRNLFVIRADGTLEGAGENGNFTLNRAERNDIFPSLIPITGIPPVKDVSANVGQTLAVTNDGTVLRWGADYQGYSIVRHEPSPVAGLPSVRRVFVGGSADFAIDESGVLWSWGNFNSDNLGRPADAATNYDPYTGYVAPAPIPGLPTISKVVVSNGAVLALGTDGSVWSWGSSYGELGFPSSSLDTRYPHQVTGLGPVGDLAASYSVLALAATSRLTGFTLAETTTHGYRNVKGTVTLDRPAGPGGVRVSLASRTLGQNVPNGLPTSGTALKLTAVPSPRPTLRKVWKVRNTTNVTRYLTAWTLFAPQAQSITVAPNSDAYFVTQAWPCNVPSLELLFEGTQYVSLAISNNQTGDTPLNVFASYGVPAEVVVPEGQTSAQFDVFANEVPVDARAEITATKGDASFTTVLKTVLESDRPKP